jgi:hypothetical protein
MEVLGSIALLTLLGWALYLMLGGGKKSFVYKQKPCDCELDREICHEKIMVYDYDHTVVLDRKVSEAIKCPKFANKITNLKSIKEEDDSSRV